MSPRVRRSRPLLAFASVLAAAALCGPAPTASAVTASAVTAYTAPASTSHIRPAPGDDEEPCPNGEPKPCGASPGERTTVDDDRKHVNDDVGKAKDDIKDARKQAGACPPTSSTDCMSGLMASGEGDRKDLDRTRKDADKTRQEMDAYTPAPADNAGGAVRGACPAFAAELPAVLTSPGGPFAGPGVCELMNA
ncbi:hypothetical protein GCM10010302_43140 [Streptomyces polychromogenes]|uniref:Secreted protein n=1 Tax=Streptomyces polychromogenes TaxID=67342 RepID=A0ABN0VGW2_9ACTN